MQKAKLFTLGYEGSTVESFLERVQAAGVRTVMDVRQLPLSRKKGFSKTAFRQEIERAGLGYVHLAAFGCPKPIRDAYKVDADWSAYTRDFSAHLRTKGEAVRELWESAQRDDACLVCFERDHTRCHRSIVADAAWKLGGLSIEHLAV